MKNWCYTGGLWALVVGVLGWGGVSAVARDAEGAQPNVVLMFVDNVGYGDLGCYGNEEVKTPRMDGLAAEGVLCTDFYIGSPSCMPSRGALMTGRSPVRNGLNEQIYQIDELEQTSLPLREKLFPEYLKELGYATACFGKWNLGFAPGHRPTERGFDEYLGNISGNCDYYTHIYNGRPDFYRGTEPVEIKGYTTDIIAEAACEFMWRHRDAPFFVYVPFNAAHFPNAKNKPPGEPVIWQATDWAFGQYGYDPGTLDERERYRAVLTALDHGVGRILDALDELKLADETIVILLSDNGAFMIPGRGLECASNLPLKAGGQELYEGGIRVPCVVRWPGVTEAGTVCEEPLWSMDLLPTAVAAAGGQVSEDRVLDGKDVRAVLAGEAVSPHEHLCFHYEGRDAIREGKWKLYRRRAISPWELFDLETDIGETANRAAAHPDVVERLAAVFEKWKADAELRSD
ncbi:MAG: sulfatase-like hydrolase/transferase [Verrucomicrobiota bacterium]